MTLYGNLLNIEAEEFVSKLEMDLRKIYSKYMQNIAPMEQLSPAEELEFENADLCNVWKNRFKVIRK